ncbi:transcription factor bHLH94-like [Curcuma longa]|uniref:transcription factor bHLH94-like n=1 Tax=Curcuma longa TaxID=136217 RepID=UPI003D9F6514
MALQTVVFLQDLFGYTMKELFSTGEEFWGCDFGGGAGEEDDKSGVVLLEGNAGDQGGRGLEQNAALGTSCSSMVQIVDKFSSLETYATDDAINAKLRSGVGRRKRQRWRSQKNQEEVENQRMTHIAVERNRRKQMNEYLAVLRSLMPASYVAKSDQASIIGGAINFVKELEKLVQTLEAHKRIKQRAGSAPFADLFTFAQCSSDSSRRAKFTSDEKTSETMVPAADIDVSMVDCHANLKVLSPRRPKQLLRLVVGLQNLNLTTLHLNVTTIHEIVFYSFSLKVENECQLASADEIATAVHQLLGKIQREDALDRTM